MPVSTTGEIQNRIANAEAEKASRKVLRRVPSPRDFAAPEPEALATRVTPAVQLAEVDRAVIGNLPERKGSGAVPGMGAGNNPVAWRIGKQP